MKPRRIKKMVVEDSRGRYLTEKVAFLVCIA